MQVPAPDGVPGASSTSDIGNVSLDNGCQSDAAGEFECHGLAAGWYRVTGSSAWGDRVRSEPVRVDAESKPQVDLILPATGDVRVRVSGRSPNATFAHGVFAHDERSFPIPARPRGDDYVLANLLLGRYRITIGQAARELGPSATDIELTQAGQIIDVELRAPSLASISGTVVDSKGEPVPDAWVKASLAQAGLFFPENDPVLTNSDGGFELPDLPAGRYAVTASHSLGEAHQLEIATGQRGVRLVLEDYAALTGSLATPDGQPVARFSVILLHDGLGQPLSVQGQRGSWSAQWLAPGDYRVIATSPMGTASTQARVKPGETLQLALKLDPSSRGAFPSKHAP